MSRPSVSIRAWVLAAVALLSGGCTSAVSGFINRGSATPVEVAVFSAEHALALDVYRPTTATNGRAPVVVFFYGGGWQRGARAQYRFVGSRLAQQGIVAIVADYRTWPRSVFPGFVDDAAQAVAWTVGNVARFGGDPQRIFIAGHSAGAQIAGLLGTDARYLRRAGVPLSDIAGVIGLSGPFHFDVTGDYQAVFGPPSQWRDAQVVNFVTGAARPFLLVSGDADRTVDIRESRELDAKLRAAGVSSTLVVLPGGGHLAPMVGLYSPRRQPAVVPAIVSFVSPATAPASPPPR